MRLKQSVLLCFCGLAVAHAAFGQESRPAEPGGAASNGWWDDLFADVPTTLSEVRAKPEAFRGRRLRFEIQFRKTAKVADAYHTGLATESHLNIVAWPGAAPLWEERAYREDHAFLFMRRDHPEAAALGDAPQYARFIVQAKVVEVLRGEPWIEIVSARLLPGRLTEPALVRITKAHRLRVHRKFDAAAAEYIDADDGRLSTELRVRLKRDAADCFETARRYLAAAATLREALALAPDDVEVIRRLSAVRARLRDERAEERPAADLERAPASRPSDG